jgi:hypothetical protein
MNRGLPWSQYYWADWLNEPTLRLCGYAARGLWADMLALMYQSDEPGRLMINGKAMTPDQLAHLRGGTTDEVKSLLAELEGAGVFSRDEGGVIFSRRMVRDSIDRESARQRQQRHRTRDRQQACHAAVTPPSRVEAKAETETEKKQNRELPTAHATAFAEFWRAYPKKVSKAVAEKAFRKLPNPAELLPVLLQAIAVQKATDQWQKDGGQFIPYPATWLNQCRWEDDPAAYGDGKNGPHAATGGATVKPVNLAGIAIHRGDKK